VLALHERPGDWSGVVTRRANLDCPVYRLLALGFRNPAVHLLLPANGTAARPGWSGSPDLEALREAWIDAPDAASRTRLAAAVQVGAMQDLPYVPLGQFSGRPPVVARCSGTCAAAEPSLARRGRVAQVQRAGWPCSLQAQPWQWTRPSSYGSSSGCADMAAAISAPRRIGPAAGAGGSVAQPWECTRPSS